MITINATGDTTLHTAGKYCPEDILVKVPAGGSGGTAVETCTVHISWSAYTIYHIAYTTIDDNDNLVCGALSPNSTLTDTLTITCVVGSPVAISSNTTATTGCTTSNHVTLLQSRDYFASFSINSGGIATISFGGNTSGGSND